MPVVQHLLSITRAGAVALTTLSVVTVLTADAALADRKDGRNDNRPGNSENAPGHNRSDERPGMGVLARELGPLNAANASIVALLNSAPDSNTGQIAVYRQEAAASIAAAAALQDAEAAYRDEL